MSPSMSRASSAIEWRTHRRLIARSSSGSKRRARRERIEGPSAMAALSPSPLGGRRLVPPRLGYPAAEERAGRSAFPADVKVPVGAPGPDPGRPRADQHDGVGVRAVREPPAEVLEPARALLGIVIDDLCLGLHRD